MGKAKEEVVKVKKVHRRRNQDLLHVSKSIKIAATMYEIRGYGSKREYIRQVGTAERDGKRPLKEKVHTDSGDTDD